MFMPLSKRDLKVDMVIVFRKKHGRANEDATARFVFIDDISNISTHTSRETLRAQGVKARLEE